MSSSQEAEARLSGPAAGSDPLEPQSHALGGRLPGRRRRGSTDLRGVQLQQSSGASDPLLKRLLDESQSAE
jgi:hypothetical protein